MSANLSENLSETRAQSIILLVDCNSFFCSCERLFRPDLKNKPVGVLSNNDGCFVSRSKEFKALGIPMGAPYFKYKDVCIKNKAYVFSSNFSLYVNLSDRVMDTLEAFADNMEVYSVDEAFLELKQFTPTKQFKTIEDYAHHIKNTVEQNTGIPVSIGIGPTKTLAKIANHMAKDKESLLGVMSLLDSEVRDQELKFFPIEEIWGIGRALAPRLRVIGINTAKDLKDYNNERHILKAFSQLELFRIKELRGIQMFHLNKAIRSKKSIMCSRSFGKPVFSFDELKAAVSHHAFSACEKLRKQNSVCRYVRVSIRTNRFKDIKQYYGADEMVLDMYTSDTRKIIEATLKILERIYVKGYEYKKAGVSLGAIQERGKTQLSLFEKEDNVKTNNLMKSIDFINKKSGQETIKFAISLNPKKSWRMNQNLKSPKYVTGWDELPKVK